MNVDSFRQIKYVNRDNRVNVAYVVFTRRSLPRQKVWLSAQPAILLLILYLPEGQDPEQLLLVNVTSISRIHEGSKLAVVTITPN